MFQLEAFKNPPSAYRIHPFWFWNGDMDDQEIIRQITEMADKGVGGFFICPRQGLTVPYLSEEWFEKVKLAAETAKKWGLDVWLYDEYPYPSGMAGGEVTLIHPDAKHYTLVHKSQKVEGTQTSSLHLPWGRVLSAKAVPIDIMTGKKLWDQSLNVESYIGNFQAEPVYQKAGLTAYNQKRFFTYSTVKTLKWTAPEGSWEIHCFLEEEIEDFKYYGTFVDPCNKEAIQTFLELTHNRYSQILSQEFGTTVKGIFSDETGLLGKIPWSPKLAEFFKEKNGYELKENLHLLISDDVEKTAKVRYDYFQSIHLLLRESYHKQIHDWCEEHGLQYVAEVPSVRMSTQLYSHIPGGDSAHEKLGRSLDWILERYTASFRANPKMVSSLSNQLGRERALIESFHSVGWSMTLQDAKWMLDRLAAFGINFYNFHAFFYTLNGLTKHDAPPSQFFQNPYWQHFRLLADYAGRLGFVMSSGTAIRSIALLDPTTSLWTHMGNPFHDFRYSGEDEWEKAKLDRLKQEWSEICHQLSLNYLDYDHLDCEILANAEVTDGKIMIGQAQYSALVLPPLSNIETAAWKKIRLFLEQGGLVIANGLLPYESIDESPSLEPEILETFGLADSTFSDYWNNQSKLQEQWVKGGKDCYFIPSGETSLIIQILKDYFKDDIQFEPANSKKSFLVEKRKLSNQELLIFISNQEEGVHQATISVPYPCEFHRLDLETGEVEFLISSKDGLSQKLDLHFGSYQSHLIQIIRRQRPLVEQEKSAPWLWGIQSKEAWTVKALQENFVRLDRFELVLDTGESKGSTVQVKTFIDQCADIKNQQALPVTFYQVFGTPMKVAMNYPIACTYQKEFVVETFPNRCCLVMDTGAISGNYQIFINEHRVNGFKQNFIYDQHNQICNVLPYLKQGMNRLRIEVTVEHDWDGVVDALYLMGDFGVSFNQDHQPIMTSFLTTSSIHQGPYSSYPFFAGTLSFSRKVHLERIQEVDFQLYFSDLDKHFHDCMEVFLNGQSLGVRAWTPYQWFGKPSLLHEGENEIEVRITNTLVGLLEGNYFNYGQHKLFEVTSLKD